MYDWSGFYLGANGGWGSSQKCWDFSNAAGAFNVSEGCHDATGGTAGGQVGYRFQSSSIVFGVEAQGNWANFRGSNVSLPFPAVTNATRVDAFGMFTGQIGYAWNNTLLYLKGGAALTSDRYWGYLTANGLQISNTVNDTRWGGVIGVGLEYGFAPNWSCRGRIQPHVHAGQVHRLHQQRRARTGRHSLRLRPHPSGRRPRHRPHQLSLGWRGRRQVLIVASSPLLPRSGGQGSGVGGLSAYSSASEFAEARPTPDPSPPRASARGGRGAEGIVLRTVA